MQRGLELEPEEWLDSLTDEQYGLWEAYSRLEPWWGQRELLASLLATMRCLLASKYDKDKVAAVLKSADDLACSYMPADWVDQPERVEVSEEEAIAAVQRQLEARFG